jgi:hypothetical protein
MIVIYKSSALKMYNSTGSLVCLENKNIFSTLKKRSSLLITDNAGVVLAPGHPVVCRSNKDSLSQNYACKITNWFGPDIRSVSLSRRILACHVGSSLTKSYNYWITNICNLQYL